MHPDEYQSLMDTTAREHCYHDTGHSAANNFGTRGVSKCCYCGHDRRWHTEQKLVEGHGRFFKPTTTVFVWDDAVPESCEEHEKKNGR